MNVLISVVEFLRLFGAAARAWWDDDATRLGASLADYTLFAIAPILLVATAIAGMDLSRAPRLRPASVRTATPGRSTVRGE